MMFSKSGFLLIAAPIKYCPIKCKIIVSIGILKIVCYRKGHTKNQCTIYQNIFFLQNNSYVSLNNRYVMREFIHLW